MVIARAKRWAAALTVLFVWAGALAQDAGRLATCTACHGADGNSVISGTPSLAGQPRVFLEHYLVMTREGLRGSDVMRDLLKGVTDAEIGALAKHFSALPTRAPEAKKDEALFRAGEMLAAKHHCGSCHLPDYHGQEQMPRLAGQREEFLLQAMMQYRENRRPGGDTMMAAALHGIPEEGIRALAHFLSRLP